MRVLVACPDCARQFDTSGHEPGSRFHCLCGRSLTVPRPAPRDAAVIRCSACGAPRQAKASACGYCAADFTLHERDLHTLCPNCMARVSDRAGYCHHCATPLVPQPLGEPSEHGCPACGDPVRLDSRRLGEKPVPVLECPRCAGLWLGQAAFGVLLKRARREISPQAAPGPPPRAEVRPQTARLYRPCPECGRLMHRVNYGRKSGVILDSCAGHGLWFDFEELAELLRWVRHGGEQAAEQRQREERTQLARQARLGRSAEAGGWETAGRGENAWLLDLLARVVRGFPSLFG